MLDHMTNVRLNHFEKTREDRDDLDERATETR